MPSTQKTALLGLNQWLGSDKPKREDFNRDNLNVENAVKGHINLASAHVSDEDRALWSGGAFVIGSYTGNGSASRTIVLGYQPRAVVLFTAGKPPMDYISVSDVSTLYAAIYTEAGASQGIGVAADGFSVASSSGGLAGAVTPALNQTGKTYCYLAYQ